MKMMKNICMMLIIGAVMILFTSTKNCNALEIDDDFEQGGWEGLKDDIKFDIDHNDPNKAHVAFGESVYKNLEKDIWSGLFRLWNTKINSPHCKRRIYRSIFGRNTRYLRRNRPYFD